MAALLECVLSRKVDITKVVGWLKNVEESDSDSEFPVHRREFVPFLLNFLREQSSHALPHGPATPAKTPSHPRPAARGPGGFSAKMTCRPAGSASRVQLFSPASSPSPANELDAAGRSGLSGVGAFSSPSFSTAWSPASRPSGSDRRHSHKVYLGDYMVSPPDVQHSPTFQSHKGRKKSGGSSAVGGQIRRGGGRGDSSSEDTGRWDSGGKRSGRGGGYNRTSEQLSPPSLGQLNFSNMEDFPPVGSSPVSSAISKPSRRINPTPVSGDRPHSKPKTCFTSTPFHKTSSPASRAETPDGLVTAGSHMSLKEERELLKKEKTKRAQNVTSPLPSALDPCTPTKTGGRTGSNVAPDMQTTSPELSKVTFLSELELLVEVYSTCISENLVPNIFLELFFVMQLLTSRSSHAHCDEEEGGLCGVSSDVLERCYLRQTHNCVFFAVKVLENQFHCQLSQHLQDRLCQQLLQLEEVSILGPSASIGDGGEEEEDGDMEQQDEKQRFSSVLLLARLLAKFLGFISFFPYQTTERPSREIHETCLALRSKRAQVLDVCAVLSNSVRRKRTILTVPWLVEFLSMLDFIGPLLLCYRNALGALLLLYRLLASLTVAAWAAASDTGDDSAQVEEQAAAGCLYKVLEELLVTRKRRRRTWSNNSLRLNETFFQTLETTQAISSQHAEQVSISHEFRKLLAAFVSGSTARSGGIIRKITPTSAELKGTPAANRLQQKLQVDLEQAFFHNQPPSLRRTVEFVAERVGSNAVKHMKATLVQELVDQGEKMLRDGLEFPNSNSSKLNESICAQLCDAGLEALVKATRYCNEKSPEAIRVLLADETTSMVLTTSENITKRLAAEKACSWLSANIAALVRREWKSRYDRVMKVTGSPGAADPVDGDVAELVNPDESTTPKKKQGNERVLDCPALCQHRCSRPSDILIEIKELLSIAVGPRTDEELPTAPQLKSLLQRARDTLACKKVHSCTAQTSVCDALLKHLSVMYCSNILSGELPVRSLCCGEHAGVLVRPSSGSEPAMCELLEQLAELWGRSCCLSAPLHQLFSPLTITAVLKASNTEKTNYLFLVRRLVDEGLLSEDDVLSQWKKLTHLALPALIQSFQLRSNSMKVHSPPADMLRCLDTL
ncbi:codanin-1 [Nematolebias whitei]|uniref:codanin-1 n=1 Tax=Nematolebias whitei TaxID=451745 RepID=UPI00189A791E|nr:codanin-1 [Nematolebias whitei]